MDVQKRIDEIRNQLLDFPAGKLTYKKIKGKEQPYLQWTENGRVKSKYVKVSERENVLASLSKRDALLAELRELLHDSHPKKTSLPHLREIADYHTFHTTVISGAGLKTMVRSSERFDRRDCFVKLQKYILGDYPGKVCLMYGLRRTGKTTLLFQLINSLPLKDFARAAYIKANPGNTMAQINQDMKKLRAEGYVYIFIDEVTLIPDFIDSAALFSDIYASMGMKIVLSGTDSLGFWFTLKQELYDRAFTIHTTFIPFREFSRLLKIDDIDEYIRYGGTLKAAETAFDDPDALSPDAAFRDDESTRRYIDTAICQNIQHSLNCCRDGLYFRHLRALYDNGELTGAINRIIESMNHQFLLRVLTQRFKSHDLGSAAEILRKQPDPEKQTDILDEIDRTAVTESLMNILLIKNQDNMKTGLTETHVQEIREYLNALDLVIDCPRETYLTDSDPIEYVLFTQPGMRFCQAQALVHVLLKDTLFSETDEHTKRLVCDCILSEVKGRMLEDIVLLETVRTLPAGKRAFKLTLSRSEFDMVIYDSDSDSCELYEIKYSTQVHKNLYHTLLDEEACQLVEKKYGKITGKYVLYRGPEKTEVLSNKDDFISFMNVESYLKSLVK